MAVNFQSRTLLLLLPEIALFFTTIFCLLADLGYRHKKKPAVVIAITLFGLAVALVHTIMTLHYGTAYVLSKSLLVDPVSQFFKILLIFTGLMVALLGWLSHEVENNDQAEVQSLIVLCTLGMCIMSSATHLLLLFLAYEMVNFVLYVLVAFKRKSSVSTEAGIKAFAHGALSSIFFALGIALLYGIGKSFSISEIHQQLLSATSATAYVWLAFGLIFVAIATRMAAFPFHFVSMDMIEGAPVPFSAFLTLAPVIAAMSFALRICVQLFSAKQGVHWAHLPGIQWPEFIAGIAAATMTIGNLTALYQQNLKRLLAFSVMVQVGFVLMGLAVSNHVGVAALLFSLTAYGTMTLGAFFLIQWVIDHARSENIQVLRGLVWKHPYHGVMLCIFLLGLAGLPPLMGFVGRFYVLGVVIREKLYWLSLIAALNWVIGLTYFLSMIRQIFAPIRSSEESVIPSPGYAVNVALLVLLIPTLFFGVYWDPLMNYISRSLEAVTW